MAAEVARQAAILAVHRLLAQSAPHREMRTMVRMISLGLTITPTIHRLVRDQGERDKTAPVTVELPKGANGEKTADQAEDTMKPAVSVSLVTTELSVMVPGGRSVRVEMNLGMATIEVAGDHTEEVAAVLRQEMKAL